MGERLVFFGNIETFGAVNEYQTGGRCIRLFVVSEKDYINNSPENGLGVSVRILEVSYWEVRRHLRSVRSISAWEWSEVDDLMVDYIGHKHWYRVEVVKGVGKKHGYTYSVFSGEEPEYFELVSFERVDGVVGELPSFKNHSGALDLSGDSEGSSPDAKLRNWCAHAFYVGQGMCSLISDGVTGVFLDIGAGTPITRSKYLGGYLHNNDILRFAESLSNLYLIISHADHDHWRILAWDSKIRNKIVKIFVPAGAKSLALSDASVNGKVFETSGMNIILSGGSCSIDVYRSDPSRKDDNGECLVSIFRVNGKVALFPGDYVYRRFLSDRNSDIVDITSLDFDAVVVPHHGDKESSFEVVSAKKDAVAFFSAGNHRGYRHPASVSLNEHSMSGYCVVRGVCANAICGFFLV